MLTIEFKTLDETNKDEWNGLVRSKSNIYQTFNFAQYRKYYFKAEPCFVIVYDDKTPVLACLFTKQAPFHHFLFEKTFLNMLLTPLTQLKPNYLALNGPVFVKDLSQKKEIINFFLQNINQHFGSRAVIMLEKSFLYQDLNSQLFSGKDHLVKRKDEMTTVIVDLNKSEEDLYKALSKEARKSLKKTQGITVESVPVEEFYPVYVEFCKLNKNRIYSIDAYKSMQKYFDGETSIDFLMAKKDGAPVAGIIIQRFADIIVEIASVRTKFAIDNKINSGDNLKWHILTKYAKLGCMKYDLMGVTLKNSNEKEELILRFKKKWGGRVINYFDIYLGKT